MDLGRVPPLAPTNTEDPDPAIAALYASALALDPTPGDYRERSANIWADSKLLALKNFLGSRKHEARLLAHDTATTSTLREENRYAHQALQSRLDWRESMDKQLERLILDMDLMQDKSVRGRCDRQRCQHLDNIFQWYEQHGRKEARKEVAGPAYLKYSADSPVMPGSLRIAPMEDHRPRSMKNSSSAPSLLMTTGLTAVQRKPGTGGGSSSPMSPLRMHMTTSPTFAL
jgi:hypothetical protein